VTKNNLIFNEDRDTWRKDAACRNSDPNLFFPVGDTGPAIELIANAKAICVNCAAQTACLEYALATRQDYGIWGGTTEEERKSIISKKRQATA